MRAVTMPTMPGMPRPTFTPSLLAPRHWPAWLGAAAIWLIAQLPQAALLWLGRRLGALVLRVPSEQEVIQTKPTLEGAGVKLQRAFGFGKTKDFDPFLLLDDFRNDNPADYLAGFPWHPHRGIETITYVLAGSVEHGDSLGNKGAMKAGDVQWMTAGSGILHQEMPKGDSRGRMHGFQLWANLPASLKMTDPRYQDIPSSAIPEVTDDDGTKARIICGEFWARKARSRA